MSSVAARFGLRRPADIEALEEGAAQGVAGRKVKADQRVVGDRAYHATAPLPVIKAHYGIRSADGIAALELKAVEGRAVGEKAWRGEESMETLAGHLGIESERGKAALDWQAVHGPGLRQQR